MSIEKQYNHIAQEFIAGAEVHNEISRPAFYSILDFDMRNKRVLDVGWGDGYDIRQYQKKGALMYGIDASDELVKQARINAPGADISTGLMENLPYPAAQFDAVLSKYVLQASRYVPLCLREMDRVLKLNCVLAYLAVHPIRQFLEKKKHPKDYSEQEIVTSVFFGGKVTVREPSHTLNEYLNHEFLMNYRITHFSEHTDFPSSEKVDGDTYPCFFIVKAVKK
jgi:ubiquinone/menaquinone biosynthesis C-methylase UbiE